MSFEYVLYLLEHTLVYPFNDFLLQFWFLNELIELRENIPYS